MAAPRARDCGQGSGERYVNAGEHPEGGHAGRRSGTHGRRRGRLREEGHRCHNRGRHRAGEGRHTDHLHPPAVRAVPVEGRHRKGRRFDVDVVDQVAKKLGVTQEIVDTPFEGIKSGADLNAGKCDIAAAGMTITDERKKVLDFSDPYFDATQALAVLTGSSVKSLEDLTGKRIGVQGSTTGEDYIKAQVAEKGLNIEVVSYKDLAAQQQALATNQIEPRSTTSRSGTSTSRTTPARSSSRPASTPASSTASRSRRQRRAAQGRERVARGGPRGRHLRLHLRELDRRQAAS